MNIIKQQSGFTLMEVLVALFILSIMSIAAVSGLNAILRAQSHQVGVAHQLQALQLTYSWLMQDLNQFVERPVLSAMGEELPALMLNSDMQISSTGLSGMVLLVLTRGGIMDPSNRTSLQRVGYVLQNNQLVRNTWAVLDSLPSTLVRPQVLLDEVASVQLRYLSEQGNYYLNWRDYTGQAQIPMAIEWQITLQNRDAVTWLLPIISGSNETEATGSDENETTQ